MGVVEERKQSFEGLIDHLVSTFQSGEINNSFNCRILQPDTEEQGNGGCFADEH